MSSSIGCRRERAWFIRDRVVPSCGHPIRWYHNIPVLSWLMLRGRCHDCGAKISSRYLFVELTGGLMFVGLAALEVWPAVEQAKATPVFMPHSSGAEIVARYCYHLWLVATLLAAALIERDGHRVPRRMIWLGIIVGLATAAGWPRVQPEFSRVLPYAWDVGARWSALAASAAGGLIGLMAGWIYGLVGAPSAKNLPALQNRLSGNRPAGWIDVGLRRHIRRLARGRADWSGGNDRLAGGRRPAPSQAESRPLGLDGGGLDCRRSAGSC